MVNVSVEVRSGTARFMVGVQAKNIQQALSIVQGRYPAKVVRMKFPIYPEGFIAEEERAA
jgi:hypothetical protein